MHCYFICICTQCRTVGVKPGVPELTCFPEIQQSPEGKDYVLNRCFRKLNNDDGDCPIPDHWLLITAKFQSPIVVRRRHLVEEVGAPPIIDEKRSEQNDQICVSQDEQAEDQLLRDHISHLLHRDTWREVRHIIRVANRKQSVQKLHFHKDLKHGGREKQTAQCFWRSAARI